jgi:hypothetical protein
MSTGISNNGQSPLLPPPPPPPPLAAYAVFSRNLTSTKDRHGNQVTVGDRFLILENRQCYAGLKSSVAKVSGIYKIGLGNWVLAKMEDASDNDKVVRINTNKTDFPTVSGQKMDEIAIRSNHVASMERQALVSTAHVDDNALRIKIKQVISYGYQRERKGSCCLCFLKRFTKSVVDYDQEEHWLCEKCADILMGERVGEDLDALEAARITAAGKRPREPVDGDADADPNGKRPAVHP